MCKTKLGLGQYQETIIVWKRKKEDKFQVHWIYLLGLFDTSFDKKMYRATISFIPKSISSMMLYIVIISIWIKQEVLLLCVAMQSIHTRCFWNKNSFVSTSIQLLLLYISIFGINIVIIWIWKRKYCIFYCSFYYVLFLN